MTLVLCTGTATEVGKTWVGAATLRTLRDMGRSVAARKPAQSFDPGDPGDPGDPATRRRIDVESTPTDADVLAEASGETAATVCLPHRWYEVPMAPPMAASVLGRPPFSIDELAAEVSWPDPAPDVCWIEMAGGVRSPLASDGGDSVDLCRILEPDIVVLVADAGLGVINAVRLCCAALTAWPVIVLLNRCDGDLAERNRTWLAGVDGFDVLTDPVTLAERLSGTRFERQRRQ